MRWDFFFSHYIVKSLKLQILQMLHNWKFNVRLFLFWRPQVAVNLSESLGAWIQFRTKLSERDLIFFIWHLFFLTLQQQEVLIDFSNIFLEEAINNFKTHDISFLKLKNPGFIIICFLEHLEFWTWHYMVLVLFEQTFIHDFFITQVIEHKVHETLENLFLLMILELIIVHFIQFVIKIRHLSLVQLIIV